MRMCLAGCESRKAMQLMNDVGQRHVLVSYYYLKSKNIAPSELRDSTKSMTTVLVDSGAFTFFSGKHFANMTSKQERIAAVTKYVEGYAEYLAQAKDFVTGAFEMDWDIAVGSKQCWEWHKMIAQSGATTLPVYHGDSYDKGWIEDCPEVFEDWCKRFPYIAIGSSMFSSTKWRSQINRLMIMARRHRTKVHGLGVTGYNDIKNLPMFTIDSTSWTSGARFGSTFLFQNGRVKAYDAHHKSVRKRWRAMCDKYQIDFAKFLADDNQEVEKWNILQWRLFADAMELQHKNRNMGYWEEDAQVKEVEEKEVITIDAGQLKEEEPLDISVEETEPAAPEGEEEEKALAVLEATKADILERSKAFSSRTFISNPTMLAVGVACSSCYLGNRCPFFKEEAQCSISSMVSIGSKSDIMGLVQTLLEVQAERTLRGAFVEKMDGGMLNGEVSKEIGFTMGLIERFKDLTDNREEVVIKAKGQGVLSQIFGLKPKD